MPRTSSSSRARRMFPGRWRWRRRSWRRRVARSRSAPVADSELLAEVRGFPARLGTLMIDPRRALAAIEATGRGGLSLLLMWCVAAALTLRFTDLAEALSGYEAGGGLRVVSVLAGELSQAI